MELKELTILLQGAVAEGAEKALIATGTLSGRLSKSEAYRTYGRSNVDRWVLEGLIKVSNKCIDRIKLEAIAESSNRITYLPVADR